MVTFAIMVTIVTTAYWLLWVHKHAKSALCTFPGLLVVLESCGSFAVNSKKNKYVISYAEEVSVISLECGRLVYFSVSCWVSVGSYPTILMSFTEVQLTLFKWNLTLFHNLLHFVIMCWPIHMNIEQASFEIIVTEFYPHICLHSMTWFLPGSSVSCHKNNSVSEL